VSAAVRFVLLASALLAAGCASTDAPPPADRPPLELAAVPASLPAGAGPAEQTPALDWCALVLDAWLRGLVEAALANNRDLRVAVANVQRAQAQLSLADANRWPSLNVGAAAARAPNAQGREVNNYSVGFQVPAWEIDFFGRLANLSDAARAQLLATEAGRRAAELSVTAATLQAALAVQADAELIELTRRTLAARESTALLTRLRESAGAASQLELQAQLALVAQARAALAQFTRAQAQDRNLLAQLVGGAVPEPPAARPRLADERWFAEVPAGLSSAVLLRRPDVAAAEQTLAAAQANIAAARAAFWPTISLTAQAGVASGSLSSLFVGGQFAPIIAASAVLPIFDAGRRQAGVDTAEAAQRIAQAQYELAIQAAFRETADALAAVATWREQLDAQRAQRDAARDTVRLTDLKAERGAASALEQLDAQRNLLAAEQAVVQARLAELASRVALYKALGG
jgi:multidrug efflux system outer membrane protein